MRHAICCFMSFAALVLPAQAQVFKCANPQGKTIYSDRPCATGHAGGQLLRERTFEERWQEREQAYEAQLAKEERRAAEQARELAIERAAFERRRQQEAMQPPAPQHKGYAERLAERNAGVKSVFEKPLTRAQRGLPPVPNQGAGGPLGGPPAPSAMTHCGGGFCYDNQGGVYHQHGNGVTMTGPNGGTCIQTGGMVNC